jgi:hypothetical protein
MTDPFTIGSEELAFLCDFVGGWGAKWGTNNLETDKRQALDRLIENGFLEPAAQSITKCQHTKSSSVLAAQLCVGISGGLKGAALVFIRTALAARVEYLP